MCKYGSISVHSIQETLGNAGKGTKIIILDMCRIREGEIVKTKTTKSLTSKSIQYANFQTRASTCFGRKPVSSITISPVTLFSSST